MRTLAPPAAVRPGFAAGLKAGLHFSWPVVFLIILVNTGFAAVYWIEDPRPFWHPLLSVQCAGLAIAYCVNVAAPWASRRPLLSLSVAVAVGSLIGLALTIVLKGYTVPYMIE